MTRIESAGRDRAHSCGTIRSLLAPELYDRILAKLVDDGDLDDAVAALVDAACRGDGELSRALEASLEPSARPVRREPSACSSEVSAGVFLRDIEVRSFRGIGETAKLSLDAQPGLTLVLGRNGSGKSSFADAAEVIITGSCRRWTQQSADWRQGWRNIHGRQRPRISATFVRQGGEPLVVARAWPDDDLDREVLTIRQKEEAVASLRELGWDVAAVAFRPFLSYPELGVLAQQPSRLYDELESILGLEEVASASKRLANARLERQKRAKNTETDLDSILEALAGSGDPRAAACRDALAGRARDFGRVEKLIAEAGEDEATDEVQRLRRLAELSVPSAEALAPLVAELRGAVRAEQDLRVESALQADALVALLEKAVAYRHAHGGDGSICPACEQSLPGGWDARASARLEEARTVSSSIRSARDATRRAEEILRARIRPAPPDLAHAASLGLTAEASAAWEAWSHAPTGAVALADHVDRYVLDVEEAATRLRDAARARLESVQSAWAPLARRLAEWLPRGRDAARAKGQGKQLKKAETWLKEIEEVLRDERFEPIAQRAMEIWELLRQQSNVSLAKVELERAGNKRKVRLNVTVDGQDSVALAVMSQGELNALSLSLFLPRMTLPEAPFRFLVIDDPVQAMDPTKVDGLARVLADVASTRQVIVFTHDTRLGEAVRRLQIDARVLEVARHPDSKVEIRDVLDPIQRQIEDARALLHSDEKLGRTLIDRIVPVFCRGAIEAACKRSIQRRRLGRGERHEDVEDLVRGLSTNDLIALALFDDAGRGAQVLAALGNRVGSRETDSYKRIKDGTHGSVGADRELVKHAETIARYLEALQ